MQAPKPCKQGGLGRVCFLFAHGTDAAWLTGVVELRPPAPIPPCLQQPEACSEGIVTDRRVSILQNGKVFRLLCRIVGELAPPLRGQLSGACLPAVRSHADVSAQAGAATATHVINMEEPGT